MLTRIKIENFKSLKSFDYKCAKLNLLTGLNGSGKSSLIQFLRLLKDIVREDEGRQEALKKLPSAWFYRPARRTENHYPVRYSIEFLGRDWTVGDSVNPPVIQKKFGEEFFISEAGGWSPSMPFSCDGQSPVNWDVCDLAEILGGIEYVGACRLPPEGLKSSFRERSQGMEVPIGNLGAVGEDLPTMLWVNSGLGVQAPLRHPKFQDTGWLIDQVNAWLGQEISPGAHVYVSVRNFFVKKETQHLIREQSDLQFCFDSQNNVYFHANIPEKQFGRRIENGRVVFASIEPDEVLFKPEDVGTGMSNILPLLITCLLADKGKCLLIENPELHLHPRGQAKMGELIARAVAAGAQVFVETHSDHVINGIRVAVKKGIVKPEDVSVACFNRDEHLVFSEDCNCPRRERYSEIEVVLMDKNGALSAYPKGFMDEWNSQLLELLR